MYMFDHVYIYDFFIMLISRLISQAQIGCIFSISLVNLTIARKNRASHANLRMRCNLYCYSIFDCHNVTVISIDISEGKWLEAAFSDNPYLTVIIYVSVGLVNTDF